MSLLIRLISGSTRVIPISDAPTLSHLTSILERYESIPSHLVYFTSCGQYVTNDTLTSCHNDTPITCHLRILGGKGGFGSLLRAATTKVGAKKTTNFSACRDLNGRRLRHVEAEEKIANWSQQKQTPQQQKALRNKYKNIKEGKQLEKKPCPWGLKCKYQYKCKLSHPLDPEKEAARQKKYALTHLTSSFGTDERLEDSDDEDSQGRMLSAVEFGLKQASKQKQPTTLNKPVKRKLAKVYGVDDDEEEEEETGNQESDMTDIKEEKEAPEQEQISPASEEQPEPDSDADEDEQAEAYEQSRKQQQDARDGGNTKKQKTSHETTSSTETSTSTQSSDTQSPAPKSKGAKSTSKDVTPSSTSPATSASSITAPATSISTSTTTSTSKPASSSSFSSSSSSSSSSTSPPPSYGPIDLSQHTSASDLHTYTLQHLAADLSRHGLKTGGTHAERADRLWLLKTMKIEDIPKKHKAKATSS